MDTEEVATSVAFNHQKGKFLLLKRAKDRKVHPNKWDFPSGHIDNEEPRNAALRELREETGLKGTILRTGKPFTVDAEGGRFKVHPFLVKVEGKPELSSEHVEYRWIEEEELEEFDTVEGLREDLERVGAVE